MPDRTNRFNLGQDGIERILDWVYWFQTGWLLLIGIILVLAPPSRFGSSFQFIVAVPHGDDILGAINIVIGLFLLKAMRRSDRPMMARTMRAGGLTHFGLGLVLVCGAIAGPTGVLGWAYALYVGSHMLLQSILLNAANRAK